MLFIGICGASGSGKSTLAEALRARLGERCYVINQDAYYRDHPQLNAACSTMTSRRSLTTTCCWRT